MKHFTLSVIALTLIPTFGIAQSKLMRVGSNKQGVSVVDKKARRAAAIERMRKATPSAIMLPLHEDTYVYEDGEWADDATYDLTYDTKGNVLTMLTDYEGEQSKTVYAYNDDGNVIEQTELVGDGEGGFVNNARLTKEYDSKVKSLVTKSMEYTWDNDWTLTNAGHTWLRDVNRDDAGNVMGISIKTYYDGDFEESQRTALTYSSDGKASTWKAEELSLDSSTGDFVWQGTYSMSNMTWQNTDGQIVAYDMEDFFKGDNRIKTAVVTDEEENIQYNVEATYFDNGNYTYSIASENPLTEGVFTYTINDENGSYTQSAVSREDTNYDAMLGDDDETTSDRYLVEKDEHGNVTLEAQYEDDELVYAAKYEYTYNSSSDYPAEQIYYEYDLDEEDFVPFLKVVSSNYVDVTLDIKAVSTNNEGQQTEVYSIDGTRIATSVGNLPSGIYIVKSNGQSSKIVRK